jgi:predicted permease
MDDPAANDSLSPKEHHERVSKLVGGYTAFVAALLVTVFAKGDDHSSLWTVIVISLLALSLPSLVAWTLLDFVIRVRQQRQKSMFRGLAIGLGFYPSLIAIAILIGNFSRIAAVLFGLLVAFWRLAVHTVAIVGQDKESDL